MLNTELRIRTGLSYGASSHFDRLRREIDLRVEVITFDLELLRPCRGSEEKTDEDAKDCSLHAHDVWLEISRSNGSRPSPPLVLSIVLNARQRFSQLVNLEQGFEQRFQLIERKLCRRVAERFRRVIVDLHK